MDLNPAGPEALRADGGLSDTLEGRVAVLADLHGNLPALEAVLEDAAEWGAQSLVACGDLVGGPFDELVLDRLGSMGFQTILGNSDLNVLRYASGMAPQQWSSSRQFALLRWVHGRLPPAALQGLERIPQELSLRLADGGSLRLVHGSPGDPYAGLDPVGDAAGLAAAMTAVPETVLACGHTHVPWTHQLAGRMAFNPGAVCGSLDGDWRAHYARLTWDSGPVRISHRSIAYDLPRLMRGFEDSGLLAEGGALARAFLISIQSGKDVGAAFLNHAHRLAGASWSIGEPARPIPDDIWAQAEATFEWASVMPARPGEGSAH